MFSLLPSTEQAAHILGESDMGPKSFPSVAAWYGGQGRDGDNILTVPENWVLVPKESQQQSFGKGFLFFKVGIVSETSSCRSYRCWSVSLIGCPSGPSELHPLWEVWLAAFLK